MACISAKRTCPTGCQENLGPDKIIGLSVSNLEEAVQGEREGADYLGAGAVYPTTSKDVSELLLA